MVKRQFKCSLTNTPALMISGEETEKPALISSVVETEWVTFRNLLAKKPEEDMLLQTNKLLTNGNTSY